MKRLEIVIVIIIIFTLSSCEPPVTFTEPQPSSSKSLLKFPERLQGNYKNLSDSSLLSINEKSIVRIYDFDMKQSLKDLDSTVVISGDSAIDTKTNEKTLIKIIGDSIVAHFHVEDTIFSMDKNGILKKYKGYYFVNIPYDINAWQVKKIQLSKGILLLSRIEQAEEIEQLQQITESVSDTISYNFKITKRQFKTFIKNDGFTSTEFFVKMK